MGEWAGAWHWIWRWMNEWQRVCIREWVKLRAWMSVIKWMFSWVCESENEWICFGRQNGLAVFYWTRRMASDIYPSLTTMYHRAIDGMYEYSAVFKWIYKYTWITCQICIFIMTISTYSNTTVANCFEMTFEIACYFHVRVYASYSVYLGNI